MDKTDFIVAREGFLDGVWRAKGDTIALSARQAEHLLISGQIARPAPAAPAPATGVDPAPAPTPASEPIPEAAPRPVKGRG